MTQEQYVANAEKLRARVAKLGFKSSVLILQPEDGQPCHVIVDTDTPGHFIPVADACWEQWLGMIGYLEDDEA